MSDTTTLDPRTAGIPKDGDAFIREIETLAETLTTVRSGVAKVIFGQQEVVDQTLVTVLAGGHALLIGVPGLAKTRLVETLGTILGLDDKRIQCTPDLMPADILGSEILDEDSDGRRSFRFVQGPVFAQLLMADEINRASPRTQSALLQAMQEHSISVAGHTHALPAPFHVLATQNPLEQEGTYPCRKPKLDRFLLQVSVGYPDVDAERAMLLATRRRRRGEGEESAERGRSAARAEAAALPPGRRDAGRGDPRDRALRPAGKQRDRRGPPPRLLGSRPPRQPGADAGDPGAGGAGRPARSVDRRRAGARLSGAAPPHGAELRRPGRGRIAGLGDRQSLRPVPVMEP